MPEHLSHHARQYLRWMRGSFIRSWWRFRYLPLRLYAYWWHLFSSWMLTAVALWAFTELYIIGPYEGKFRLSYVVVPVLLGYATMLPYLTVRRSDEPFMSRVITWLLAPLAVLWSFTVLLGMALVWRHHLLENRMGHPEENRDHRGGSRAPQARHAADSGPDRGALRGPRDDHRQAGRSLDVGPTPVPPAGRLLIGAAAPSAAAFTASTGVQPGHR